MKFLRGPAVLGQLWVQGWSCPGLLSAPSDKPCGGHLGVECHGLVSGGSAGQLTSLINLQ